MRLLAHTHTHAHTRTHTRIHTRTHTCAHTHTYNLKSCSLYQKLLAPKETPEELARVALAAVSMPFGKLKAKKRPLPYALRADAARREKEKAGNPSIPPPTPSRKPLKALVAKVASHTPSPSLPRTPSSCCTIISDLFSPDWVQDAIGATKTWGGIGDWDVSGVKDMSWAFSKDRDKKGGIEVIDGNTKAVR